MMDTWSIIKAPMSNAKSFFHRRTIERTKMSKWPNLLTIQLQSYLCQVSKLREPSARLHTKCKYGDQGRKSEHNIPEPLFKRFLLAKWLVLLDTTYLNLSESFCSSSLCLFVVDVFFFWNTINSISELSPL